MRFTALRVLRSVTRLPLALLVVSLAPLAAARTPAPPPAQLSLAGTWNVRLDPGDAGLKNGWQDSVFSIPVRLPGSLAANDIGDDPSVSTRWTGSILDSAWFLEERFAPYRQPGAIKVPFWLTPRKYYVGPAWYEREILIPDGWQSKDLSLFLERAHWETRVWLDSKPRGMQNSLCAPHEYSLGTLTPGRHRLVIRVDNTPKIDVGSNAHSISDHTQTNWNGMIGRLELQAHDPLRILDVQVFPDIRNKRARVRSIVDNRARKPLTARLFLAVRAAGGSPEKRISDATAHATLPPGQMTLEAELSMGNDARLWDERSPVVYALEAHLSARDGNRDLADSKTTTFGLREFSTRGTHFTLNGNVTFLRGTLECCVFPLTGYPPTETAAWEKVLGVAKEYGLNHIRFHSWCPPRGAFEAADRLGLILHVETPVWTVLGSDAAVDSFVYAESNRILKEYGNHPSFCMLAVGNEPSGERRDEFLTGIVRYWKERDPRRLYTTCAGWPILPVSDYHSTPEPRVHAWGAALGSRFNAQAHSTDVDYTDIISRYTVPTVSHEIGEWCVFPDLKEDAQYTGVLTAGYLAIVRDHLREKGMLDQAEDFLMASGRLQVLEYKEEIESALRTPGFGGFQLLGLHDFPGQGTALVGMLNAFWRPKGYLTPSAFRQFCSPAVPLARMQKVVWTSSEEFTAHVQFANYSAHDLKNAVPEWSLKRPDGSTFASGFLDRQDVPQGTLTTLGRLAVPLREIDRATKLTLSLGLRGTAYTNSWDIWAYPATLPAFAPGNTLVVDAITPAVEEALSDGRTVLLLANPRRVNSSVPAGFSSIFWNTAWSGKQPPHTLGILCDPEHPLFAEFPTASHSTWHWWDLIKTGKAMVLDAFPTKLRPLVQVIDDWNSNRRLGLLFEASVGTGTLVVCSMDLSSDLNARPVARQFLHTLMRYISSEHPSPKVQVDVAAVRRLFREPTVMDEAKLMRVDSEVRGFEGALAVDGDPTTIWHTPWEGGAPKYPHFVEVDLGREAEIAGYVLHPRTDGITGGWISRASLSVSNDGRQWSDPVSTDSFTRDKLEKRVMLREPVRARYVRLTALEGFIGQEFASLAEFRVIGAGEE